MSKPKSIKPPPPPAPVATVVEPTVDVEDEAKKRARRQTGYSKTILTGGLSPMSTGKNTVLG